MDTVIPGSDYLGNRILYDEKLPERPETMNSDIAAMSYAESTNGTSNQAVGGKVDEKGQKI